MVEIGIRGGIITQFINMQKLIVNTLKIMIRIKNRNFLNNGTKKNGWAVLQKMPVNGFEWVEDIFEFNEDFIKKTIMKKVVKDFFSKVIFNILKKCIIFTMIYYFH